MADQTEREALEHRYNVSRVDGRSAPGEKHHGCRYFVLDLTHDPKAPVLVDAYFNAFPEATDREERAQQFLEGLYVCTRDESAWAAGTMSLDDFRRADQDEDVLADLSSLLMCDHRTPAPHVVTTVEELRDLPDATIVKAHGYSRVAQKLLGAWYFPGALDAVTFEARMLPATVLTPAPKPVEVIHLTDFHNPSTTAMCGEPTTVVTEHGDTRPICQTCHRGAMKSAHAGAPIDREALVRLVRDMFARGKITARGQAELLDAIEGVPRG